MKCIYTTLVILLCSVLNLKAQNAQFVFAPSSTSPVLASIQAEFNNVNFVTLQEDLVVNELEDVAIIFNNDLLAQGKAKDSRLFNADYNLALLTSAGRINKSLEESEFNGRYFKLADATGTLVASIADYNHQFTISFLSDGVMWYVEPLSRYYATADRMDYIMYSDADLLQQNKGCGNDELNIAQELVNNPSVGAKKTRAGCVTAEYGFMTDWNLYNKYGGDVNALINRTMTVLNASQLDYTSAAGLPSDVNFQVVEHVIVCCDTCQPWTSNGSITLTLDSFSRAINATFDRTVDIASLFFEAGAASGTTIGLAYINGICYTSFSTGRYWGSNVIDDYTTNLAAMRNLLTHEVGHNFSCSHDTISPTNIMSKINSSVTNWTAQSIGEITAALPAFTCLATCPASITTCDTLGLYGIGVSSNSNASTISANWNATTGTSVLVQFFDNATNTWSPVQTVTAPANSITLPYSFSGCSNSYIAYMRPVCSGGIIGAGKQIIYSITHNPMPTLQINTSSTSVVMGAPVTFTVTSTNGGSTPAYTWFVNGTAAGTGATFVTSSLADNDVVSASMTSNASCATPLTVSSDNSLLMDVFASVLPAVVAVSPDATNACSNSTITYTAVVNDPSGNPYPAAAITAYQWYLNGVPAGTNNNTFADPTPTNGDQVYLVVTCVDVLGATQTFTSSTFTLGVTASVVPSITITSSGAITCASVATTFTATTVDGGVAPNYQWQINGANVGTNSATFSYTGFVSGDIVTCILTSSSPCASPTTATSNSIVMSVPASLAPSLAIVAAPGNIVCPGVPVSFVVSTKSFSGSAPSYQWQINGLNVGSNADTFSSTILATGDVVTCVMTSNDPCATPSTATSNSITMTVGGTVTPSITISAKPATVLCAGSTVTVSVATVTNGGTAPSYQWKINGVNFGGNTDSIVLTGFANGTSVSCVLTSNEPCATQAQATSNSVNFVVKNTFTPVVTVVASPPGPICQGQMVTFTASATFTGANPVYSWLLNGVQVLSGSNTYITDSLKNGDIVQARMLSSSTLCLATNPTVSSGYTATVNPAVTPEVSITANLAQVCAGKFITFTAVPLNGGSAPVYAWLRNGIPSGAGAPIWSTNAIVNNDQVCVMLTSNAQCRTKNIDTSNCINVVVLPTDTVQITVSATTDTICVGTNVAFSTASVKSGSAPVYQWKINGLVVGTNSPWYNSSTLANGDVVTCELTSSASCPSVTPAVSNPINMAVFQPTTPTVSIISNDTSICIGDPIVFTAITADGGTAPSYQWFWNGLLLNDTDTSYTNTILENTDQIYCVMTSNARCRLNTIDTSAVITMTVNDYITPAISITQSGSNLPIGASVVYNAATTAIPPYNISWYRNGVLETNTTTPSWSTFVLTNNDSVYAIIGGFSGCYLGNSASSNILAQAWATDLDDVQAPSFALYPNPVSTVANLAGIKRADAIRVFDVTGKLLDEKTATQDGIYELNMQHYAAGTYQVRISRGVHNSVIRVIKD
jgi:hypothetical protein